MTQDNAKKKGKMGRPPSDNVSVKASYSRAIHDKIAAEMARTGLDWANMVALMATQYFEGKADAPRS